MSAMSFSAPVLETGRLVLRTPRMEDFEAFFAFLQSDRSQFVRGAEIDRNQAWRAFAHVAGMWVLRGYGLFVITDRTDGAALGAAGPWHPLTWPEREIGWSLWRPEAEGKGIALEAARAACDFAFDALGWDTAVSYIDPENTRSVALAERLGARLDPDAPCPGDGPCLVYRHPCPEILP